MGSRGQSRSVERVVMLAIPALVVVRPVVLRGEEVARVGERIPEHVPEHPEPDHGQKQGETGPLDARLPRPHPPVVEDEDASSNA